MLYTIKTNLICIVRRLCVFLFVFFEQEFIGGISIPLSHIYTKIYCKKQLGVVVVTINFTYKFPHQNLFKEHYFHKRLDLISITILKFMEEEEEIKN